MDQFQHIRAADGTPLVLMTLAQFEHLSRAAAPSALPRTPEALPPGVWRDIHERGLAPIEAWRHHRRFSQVALAAASGVSRATIIRLEASAAGAGNLESRRQIAAALDVPLSAL